MKRLTVLLLIVLAMALAACDTAQNGTEEATPVTQGETGEAISDAMTTSEAAGEPAEPGDIVTEPAVTTEAEMGAGVTGSSNDGTATTTATLDTTGLPAVTQIQIIPATPYDNSQPFSPIGLPEHIRVDFEIEGQTDPTAPQPVLYVIPTADYAALWEGAGDMGVSGTLAGLQALIRERFEPFPEAGIPVLPVERVGAAFNDLAVQGKYLELDGISGMRFVGRFTQETAPVSSEGLTYVFLGFTDDAQYFVSFLYPIQTAQLPVNPDAVDPTELELFSADIDAYMAERTATLNSLAETDWTPSLAALDAALASLQLVPQETVDVVAVESSPLTTQPWLWLRTIGPAGESTVADPARYAVQFNPDGSAVIQADCNNVIASYTTSGDGVLTITLGPSTLVACPPDSQDQQFLAELAAARFYFIETGSLSIEVAEDGTTMQFMAEGEVAQGIAPEPVDTVLASGEFLSGGLWQWTSTDDPQGIEPTSNPAQYTIAFNPDGSASIQADCNRVIASYTTTEDGGMTIQPGPSTLAACGPESRDAEFVQSLTAVVFYSGAGDTLSLEMMADGGTLNFARAQEQAVLEPEGSVVDGGFVGPTWQWTVLRQLNGETAVPEPMDYTVTFNPDGTAAIQADCNVVGATYVAGSDGSLAITPGPSTLAFCGDMSLDQVFLGGMTVAQSYVVENGALVITLQLENGTMILVPVN